MYSTCLFCTGDLGRNESIEHFPIGRRLAFDAAKGRLWVVCRKCERWNLTPLEERWEAIEECERAFAGTKLRASTDHIGLARLREGLELVRIGEPQRPEMAVWRYGDQFGRRLRTQLIMWGGVAGALYFVGPMLGFGAGAFALHAGHILSIAHDMRNRRRLIVVPGMEGAPFRTRAVDVRRIKLRMMDNEFQLTIPDADGPTWLASGWEKGKSRKHLLEGQQLTGDDAIRAASVILPRVNVAGGNRKLVQRAVDLVQDSESPKTLFMRATQDLAALKHTADNPLSYSLGRLPVATLLALEMASHEESERRALQGELYLLEEAWRQADEIAAIADDMFLPATVDDDLVRLKGQREG